MTDAERASDARGSVAAGGTVLVLEELAGSGDWTAAAEMVVVALRGATTEVGV